MHALHYTMGAGWNFVQHAGHHAVKHGAGWNRFVRHIIAMLKGAGWN